MAVAEIALSALLEATFDKLGSAILKELGLFRSLRKDIQKLKDSLSIIRCVLTDAEEKQQTVNSVKEWLKQVKDASYDSDDILDQCATEALRRRVETEGRVINKACDFFSASNPFLFDLHMVHKIKDIRERLDDIAGKVPILGLMQTERRPSESREETHSHIIESKVEGREEDKEKVVKLLLTIDNEEKVSVISITGIGGLGKTSLAQLVCKDVRVEEHFDLRIWVSVSDDFDVRRLTKKIIGSARKSNCNDESMELLQQSLRKELSGKKFLLVLDDVWNQDFSKWDSVRSLLLAGETGSKIMVTTRNREVALIMGTRDQNLYPLNILSDDVCWSLFRQLAFGQGQEQNQNLDVLHEKIVNKCGGIPLVAKVLGSLVGSKRGEDEKKRLIEREIWNLTVEDSILPVLKLSYNHLPSHLKRCFGYCSIFPKDHRIQVEELIQLWMAGGFIKPFPGSKLTEEEIGRWYFDDLLGRSFFQDAEKDDGGNVVSCKMHDLMHDLAELVSEDARSVVSEDGEITIPDGCRHLSVEVRGWKRVSLTLMNPDRAKTLRTFWLLQPAICEVSHKFVAHLPCLRVLNLGTVFIESRKDMLNSIGGLKQLRYLCLSVSRVKILSNSLSKLHNLQTLIPMNAYDLNELPRDMRKMVSLRHLRIEDCENLTHMPAEMGELTSLQTLPVFVVGEDSGRNIRQLGNLKYLSGEFGIQNLENVTNAVNAQEAKLSEKANLRSLGLSWSRSVADAAEMLEGLQPHRNLRCLRVENYGGDRLPRWMGGCGLPNLVELSLSNWRGWEHVQLPGQFRSLKSLSVSGIGAVKCFGSDFYGDGAFPSLEEVTFQDMANLEEWSVCNGGREAVLLPSLKSLEVRGCPKLRAVPCFPLLSSLKLSIFEAESLPNCFFQNQLTHLTKFSIFYCENLESLSREIGNVAATLEELRIHNCPKLVSLFPEEMQNQSPCLRHLEIYKCDGLTSLRLQGLASLTFLSIDSCKNLASFVGGMHHLTALQSLWITNCPGLPSALADGMEQLTSLTLLSIKECAKVTHLPEGFKHATRLQFLQIIDLPNFAALPDWIGNLSSLQQLHIDGCPNLVSLPSGFQHLTNFRVLSIFSHPNLVSLPSGFQHLTNLQYLQILSCPKLVSLPSGFQHLTNLRCLVIWNCPNLVSLPSEFQYLTNLRHLEIYNCHELEKRCEKERGEDWRKISHIPHINIFNSGSERRGMGVWWN